jgi:predicted nucleic acid-binding protein
MAGTIVDTNILLDIYTQDQVWEERSAAAIAAAADVSVLVINPIIYGELSVGIERIEELDEFLGADFRRDSLPWEAAFLAGKAFLAYRRRGGLRTAPLPDFYIGAHAAVERMSILTRDAKRYVLYFPSVEIIEP